MPNGPNGRYQATGFGNDYRKFSRDHVYITIDVREHGGSRHKALIMDLSQSGCRISSVTLINVGKQVHINLPGFAPLEGTIIWKLNTEYGCSFTNPLHAAIYDHIRAKYPSLGHL